jgi:MFS family permease
MRRSYGWVVVGAGMVMTGLSFGAMMSLAVLLIPMAQETGWSRSGISSVATINFLFMGIGSILWGMLSDRIGARRVVLLGGVLLGTGLIAASRATTLLELQLTFGPMVGAAVGSFYAPMISVATAWVEDRRNLAAALVSAGMGMGSMVVSPFAGWLLGHYDWRVTLLIIGCVCGCLVLIAAALVRDPPGVTRNAGGGAQDPGIDPAYPLTAAQALRKPQFVVVALAHFACCAAHSGPIFHMVTYAAFCGLGPMVAVSVFSLAGLSGLGGRIGMGMIADRKGVKRTLVAGLVLQALAIGAYAFIDSLPAFYALAIVFGVAYGGVMPLYAVLVRDAFGPRIMGTMFGAVSLCASLGMALGPGLGGFVFDTWGNYSRLYVGSCVVGLCAVAVALMFRADRDGGSGPALTLKAA